MTIALTYIPLGTRTSSGRFGCLALLMYLCSQRIENKEYESLMDEDLVLNALRRAIRERQPRPGLIHHSDRGGQHASRQYRDVLRRSGMRQSMSVTASCYDNAFMESCFGTLKTEPELVEYANGAEAIRELSSYIRYHNLERRYSTLMRPNSPSQLLHKRFQLQNASPQPLKVTYHSQRLLCPKVQACRNQSQSRLERLCQIKK